jgi:hypothetical protein
VITFCKTPFYNQVIHDITLQLLHNTLHPLYFFLQRPGKWISKENRLSWWISYKMKKYSLGVNVFFKNIFWLKMAQNGLFILTQNMQSNVLFYKIDLRPIKCTECHFSVTSLVRRDTRGEDSIKDGRIATDLERTGGKGSNPTTLKLPKTYLHTYVPTRRACLHTCSSSWRPLASIFINIYNIINI